MAEAHTRNGPTATGVSLRIARSDTDRILTGYAAAVGKRLGIGPSYARAGFVTLAVAGGVGVGLYIFGLLLGLSAPQHPEQTPLNKRQRIGTAFVFLGVLFGLASAGLWIPDASGPIGLLAFGAAAIWNRSDHNDLPLIEAISRTEQSRFRAVGGALLMGFGSLFLFGALTEINIGPTLFAVIVTASGFLLALGPSLWRISRNLATERRDRIRAEEREDMAAHLHDSVLQSLALIQRTDDPKKMATLARAQERELREWLYSQRPGHDSKALSVELQDAATKVEAAYDVPVDVIVVGEVDVTEDILAMTRAATEAITNAAKHSGAKKVSVYAETRNGTTDIWITDLGGGFDPESIQDGRMGVSDSIVGRMLRHGGTAEIDSTPEGTEVHLSITEKNPT